MFQGRKEVFDQRRDALQNIQYRNTTQEKQMIHLIPLKKPINLLTIYRFKVHNNIVVMCHNG